MNNLSLSVGTESQYSTSSKQFEANDLKQEGAGIFSFLFGSEKGIYATELALRAFKDKLPQISCYVVKDSLNVANKIALDFTKQDSEGRTLLHFLVIYSAYFPDVKQLFLDVLEKTNAKKGINLQDSKGNTAVHYAMYLELEDVVKELTSAGANLSIKNKEGLHVMLKPVQVESAPSDIFVKLTSKCNQKQKKTTDSRGTNDGNFEYSDTINSRLNNIVKAFTNSKRKQIESDVETIGFRPTDLTETVNSSNSVKIPRESFGEKIDSNTDEIMAMILKDFEEANSQQKGGAKKRVVKEKKNTKITGKRKMITFSEMSFGGGSDDESSNDDDDDSDFDKEDSRLAEIARMINNKANDAHKNAIVRIKEILNLEDEEARAVKAILYDKIKKEKSELTNLDKAVELEKMASDESILKSIKKSAITKMVDLIRDIHSKKTISSTSSEQSTEQSEPSQKKQKNPKKQSRLLSYETTSDDSSTSSDSNTLERSKKVLELTDDSSTSSSSDVDTN